ncbi:MAG: aldolase [Spirochaetales bacterium]|jgi:4-hydroxy-2-oxoheptanedioate aldolase|nr:aldolase [Spirochaetales bacterium]
MRADLIQVFRDKIQTGFVVGPFAKTSDPGFIEVFGHAGFDFVILDLEHGPNSVQTVQNLIRAAECSAILPVIRTKENYLNTIGEVLDLGAGGIQVPQIVDRKSAEQVIEHAKFSPDGMRGVCRFVRAADYSVMDRNEYFKAANTAITIVQLEGSEAVANLESILAVDGIDIVFIGPYDLSQSLGVPGQVDHPKVVTEMRKIVEVCKTRKIYTGTFVDTQADAERWIEAGVKYISYSVDKGLMADQCRSVISSLRG